ncbi:MAG: hypothetical protein Q9227_000159 [Pyrenula ochraceoflavens]
MSCTSLKDVLEQEIESQNFISFERLRELCPVQIIQETLGPAVHSKSSPSISARVFNTGLKLFALLVLTKTPDLIVQLLEDGIDDQKLFYQNKDAPGCTEQLLKSIPLLCPNVNLLQLQWTIPPILSQNDHQRFPPGFMERLPIMKNRQDILKKGTSRTVRRVDFGGGQLEAHTPGNEVVLKKVPLQRDKTWTAMLHEVKAMRSRKHHALVPLLSSFEGADIDIPERELALYLVLPYAKGGNMQSFIETKSVPKFLQCEDISCKTWLFSQIQALYSGLAFLHRDQDDRTVLHFDLKPENILLFCETPASYSWKIADFGNSKLQTIETTPRTELFGFTREYAPPEVFGPCGQPTTRTHGQEFDVYSMGCITLQLMTVAIEGWGAPVEEFRNRRTEAQDEGESCFYKCLAVVKDWIQALKDKDSSDKASSTILEFISYCVSECKHQRPLAWEVELYLFDVLCSDLSSINKRARYLEIVPDARRPEEITSHDPIRRAKDRKRPDLVDILRERQWYAGKILYPSVESYESNVSSEKYFNNLPATFRNWRLFGRDELVRKITDWFLNNPKSQYLGIHGGGGTG